MNIDAILKEYREMCFIVHEHMKTDREKSVTLMASQNIVTANQIRETLRKVVDTTPSVGITEHDGVIGNLKLDNTMYLKIEEL